MGKKSGQISRKRKIEAPEEEEKHNELLIEEVQSISGKPVENAEGSPPPARLKRSANKMKEKPFTEEKKVTSKKISVSLPSSSPSKLKKNTTEEKEDNVVVDDIKTSTSERGVSVSNLPNGWRREAVVRKSGKTAGQIDIYFYSPEGTKLRSRPDVASYLAKHKIDLKVEEFDFSKTMKNAETVVKEKNMTENNTASRKKIKTTQDEISKDKVELKDSSKAASTKKSRSSEKSSSNVSPAAAEKDVKKKNNSDGKSNKVLIKILDSKPKKSRK